MSIPAYFYINIEKQSYRQKEIKKLELYTFGVEKAIYSFSRSKKNIFDFPRSLFYNAYLYNNNQKMIFSTNAQEHPLGYFTNLDESIINKKTSLNSNRLQAKYLIVEKEFSFKEIYIKALISALFFGSIIFFLAIFFIKISIRPFEKANKYLNAFFNDAMHELKTPLGVMQLNLEIIRSKQENKELQRLSNSLQNIILVYEDIEYFIKYTYVDYRPERVDLSLLLQERVDIFCDLAKVQNISIKREVNSEIFVFINRIEVQRIIDNTISNAIKYSDKNKLITITLTKQHDDAILSICDQGHGIENIKEIFTRHYRENSVKGGFGIGLNIVKNICDKNNIFISIDSTLGIGSTFTYKFFNILN